MAEEEGFEPSVQVSSHGHLATPCVSNNISINSDSLKNNIRIIVNPVENCTRTNKINRIKLKHLLKQQASCNRAFY